MESSTATLKNRYFLIARGAAAIEWFPPHWTAPMPRDCIYFGLAFLEMEKRCRAQGLRVYTTYDWNSLPEYGASVVVLLLGEEIGRVPRYIRHVRAVFKTMRMRPYLGIRKWGICKWGTRKWGIRKWKLDALRASLLMKAVRDWPAYWWSLYAARHTPPGWPPRVKETMNYLDVPLGYLNAESLPQKTMRERPYHCFFAGQMLAPKKSGLLGLLPLPKNESRRSMFAAAQKFEGRHPGFYFDGFALDDLSAQDGRSYSQRMMDAKICLAPRGNVVDTFRFFEGMRSGCVVVCEPLPPERYYSGAPVIGIDDWNELEEKIAPIFEDDELLETMRRKALAWWEQKCSESATGLEMASFVDSYKTDR